MTLGRLRHAVFIDSSAYFALSDAKDASHQAAMMIRRRLASERWRILTTNLIIAETHGLILNRLNRRLASQYITDTDASSARKFLNIVRVEPDDERRAREIIFKYDDKDFSLTDATSFAVMERLRIPYAFTFDRNFTQFGLDVLSPRS